MLFFRMYCTDRDGHISGVFEIEARDEAQAIRMGDRLCWREKRELWRDDRLIKRWRTQEDSNL